MPPVPHPDAATTIDDPGVQLARLLSALGDDRYRVVELDQTFPTIALAAAAIGVAPKSAAYSLQKCGGEVLVSTCDYLTARYFTLERIPAAARENGKRGGRPKSKPTE